MKKVVAMLMAAVLSMAMLAGCGSSSQDNVLVVGTNAEFLPSSTLEMTVSRMVLISR